MLSPTSASGIAITMNVLADKVSRGNALTMSENGIVVTGAAKIYADSFGPSMGEMRLNPQPLPENVKGVLTDFAL